MNNLEHTISIIVAESGMTKQDFLQQGVHLISNNGIYSLGINLSGMFQQYYC